MERTTHRRSWRPSLMATLTLAACAMLTVPALAAPPKEADVQGLYTGTAKVDGEEIKLEVRVVAQGKQTYKVFVREAPGAGETIRAELDGKTEGDSVVFKGQAEGMECECTYGDGTVSGTVGDGGTVELERVEPKSPTLGKPAPADATVLLDGKDFSEMTRSNGANWYVGDMSKDGWGVWEVPIRMIGPNQPGKDQLPTKENAAPEGWEITGELRRADTVLGIPGDGSLQVPRGGMRSTRPVQGSFDLHVEFMCPLRPDARGQARGNSGVFLPCGTEIQVLDSFGDKTYLGGGCGGLYKWKDPDAFDVFSLASYPPLTWQTYDVQYRVRKDDKGKAAGYLTVDQNGIRIHDNVKLKNAPRKGSFSYQDHGNPVRYRNIWFAPAPPD